MLDLVKYEWENRHGAWIGPEWTMILGERKSPEDVRAAARIGKPGMQQLRELDRAPIPEDVRLTGRARKLVSVILLYDPNQKQYTADEFVAQMVSELRFES